MTKLALNSHFLRTKIHQRFGSADKMIANSNGRLSPSKRASVFRALQGRPVARELAEILAELLGTTQSELISGANTYLHLSQEAALFDSALRLVKRRDMTVCCNEDATTIVSGCLEEWLRGRLHAPEKMFQRVLAELVKVGQLEIDEAGQYVRLKPSMRQVTRLLRRRVYFQWPIVRDAFSESPKVRRRMRDRVLELVSLAETKLTQPMTFFSIDDQIHECFCPTPMEISMVRECRQVSWMIAYELISDLASQMRDDPRGATLSMRSIGGWMLEDYREWAHWLTSDEECDMRRIHRQLRRHVLRMRDYAQYYCSKEFVKVQGNPDQVPTQSAG